MIATTLVTVACYIPLAFYGGMVGKMYIQFAFTMCVALCLSTFVALTLSPVLCSLLLRPPKARPPRLFAPVNFVIDGARKGYLAVVRLLVRHVVISALLFAAAAGGEAEEQRVTRPVNSTENTKGIKKMYPHLL